MCPGQNGVKIYWLKKFSALHERMAPQMDDIINNTMDNPKWMTTGKAIVSSLLKRSRQRKHSG